MKFADIFNIMVSEKFQNKMNPILVIFKPGAARRSQPTPLRDPVKDNKNRVLNSNKINKKKLVETQRSARRVTFLERVQVRAHI